MIKSKSFKIILENLQNEGQFTFVTVEECADIDDAIDHVHKEFPNFTIEQIKEVA